MSEDVGELLELLDNAKVARLYKSRIRKMQPADLVRRLESEKVSTRGHMPELRGRLLRLEARKLGLRAVPWYSEDEDHTAASKKVQQQQQQQQDHQARIQCAKLSRLRKKVTMPKSEGSSCKKTRHNKDSSSSSSSRRNDAKGYTERVLKGAAEALNKMISTITDKDFFDSMAMIRSAERRRKAKSYARLNEID